MKRKESGNSLAKAAAAPSGDSTSSASKSHSLASGSKRQRRVDSKDNLRTEDSKDDLETSSKASYAKGSRRHPDDLTSSQTAEYDRIASHFISSDIGTVASKPIPLRFMARTRHVAWQWRTKSGSMQYQSLIGGGVNTPEDSL